MYAVVKTGGKQLKVETGAEAVVEKLDAEVGQSVTLPVLFANDGDKVVADAASLAAATVTAEVVEHFQGDKVMVFKFKKRKGYKRTKGHRQTLTRLRITDISLSGAAPKKKTTSRKKAEPAATAETAEAAESAAAE